MRHLNTKSYGSHLTALIAVILLGLGADRVIAADPPKPQTYNLTNPLGASISSPQQAIGQIITIFTGIAGAVALLMFVYGGLLWLTSGGNSERVEKGKKIFTWSVIGLAVIFGSYALVSQIFKIVGVG